MVAVNLGSTNTIVKSFWVAQSWNDHDGMVERIRGIGWNDPVEFSSKPTRHFGRRWKASSLGVSVASGYYNAWHKCFVAGYSGGKEPTKSLRSHGSFFIGNIPMCKGISLQICQTWWTCVKCLILRDPRLFRMQCFFLMPQMCALEVQFAGRLVVKVEWGFARMIFGEWHLNHSTRGAAKDNWSPNAENAIKDTKGVRLDVFNHQWMKVLTCVSRSFPLREYRLVMVGCLFVFTSDWH